jgi:hypothetical protein
MRSTGGGTFVIEASTPAFRALLRFTPDRPEQGDYEIHYLPPGGVERGLTIDVTAIPKEGAEGQVEMLMPFSVRYVVYTRPTDRARTQKVWLVGLNTFRNVDAVDLTNDTDDRAS